MKTESFQVKGVNESHIIAGHLVREYKWFQCEPWPEDEFRFSVKQEEAKQIETTLAEFMQQGILSWNWYAKSP